VIIGGLAVVALAAVAIVYLITRTPGAPTAAPGPVAAATVIDAARIAAASLDAGTAATAHDAAVAVAAPDAAVAAPVDAGTKKVVPKHDPTPPPDDDPAPTGEVVACRKLLASDPEDALRCANQVLEKDSRAFEAHVVRTMAYCELEDQERAQSAIRKLNGRPALRRRAGAYCAKRGYVLQ
jgi:hypothetical protein